MAGPDVLDSAPDAGHSLREYARAVWRRRFWVLGLLLVGGAAGWWQGRRSPDVYAVATRIDIAKPRPFAGAAPTLAFGESYHESQLYYPTRYALLSSSTYVDRLLQRASTPAGPSFRMWDWLTWPAYARAAPSDDGRGDLGPGIGGAAELEAVVGVSADEFARRFRFRRYGPSPSPDARFDDPGDLEGFLANRVTVKPEKNTTLVTIELEGGDREVLAPLLNLLIEVFWREQRSETQKRLDREEKFWSVRRRALAGAPEAKPGPPADGRGTDPVPGSAVDAARTALERWKVEKGSDANRLDLVKGARAQQVLDSERQLRELEERLTTARPDLAALLGGEEALVRLEGEALDAARRAGHAEGSLAALRARDHAIGLALVRVDADAERELSGAAETSRFHRLVFATADPAAAPLLARLSGLEAANTRDRTVLDPIRKSFNAAVRDAVLRRTRELRRDVALRVLLADRLAADDADLEAQWKLAADLARLQKTQDDLVAELAKVDAELSRVRSQSTVEQELRPLKVIEIARDPGRPVKPNRPLLVLVGLGGGLLLGMALALLLDWLDDTVSDLDDVARHVGAPVVGSILALPGDKADQVANSRERALLPVAEAFRAARTSIEFAGAGEGGRILLVTSCSPREGKTTVACNLAFVLAQDGKRTLLVDADLRRPRVHAVTGVDAAAGLSAVIAGRGRLEDHVRATRWENLWVLPAGALPPNPAELLGRPAAKALLEQLRGQFDRVVVDSPPVGVVTDAAVLARWVDQVVLVVAAGRTKKHAAAHGAAMLRSVGAPLAGVVVNLVRRDRRSYYGGYYHHDTASYYGGGHEDGGASA